MNDNESPRQAPPDEPKRWLDYPANVRKLVRGYLILCGFVLALGLVFLFSHQHLSFHDGRMKIEGWFGFYAIYGFGAYTALVLISKVLRKVLMRDEDYYDR